MSTINEGLERPRTYFAETVDAAVIGAGHAGCEAALASSRLGWKTILFTMNLDAIANMPCNPNIGGTAKGQLVREIDALGGEMGKNADKTFIQSRMLNASKGPAVLSPRAQIDRRNYQIEMKRVIENQENLTLKQGEIVEIFFHREESGQIRIEGVLTRVGAVFACRALILCTGTYMESRIIVGETVYPGGPDGMFPSVGLSASLLAMGVELQRFKTGTPVRVNKKELHLENLEEQAGDPVPCLFSFENEEKPELFARRQQSCWVTWTTPETRKAILDNIGRSPLYSGIIEGTGPRYCPSIEDKFVKFPDRERHQLFIEPTGQSTGEMYIAGMSSSMPEEIQVKIVHSIPGLEDAGIMRTAYAIEYDCIVPTQLHLSLEHKNVGGLFCAGQINGSSGYEEAGAQGIMAGINAARKLSGKPPVVLDRSTAYIGVLIDDLVTKGASEPYRMMTSRAEYRLCLRQDNADERLTPTGREVGLIDETRYLAFERKMTQIREEIARLKNTFIGPAPKVNEILTDCGSTPLKNGVSLAELIRRPELSYAALETVDPGRPPLPKSVRTEVEVQIKYEGYIALETERIAKFQKLEHRSLPRDIPYGQISGLSREARQKLEKTKPDSLGQASRISGVSPADISVLLIYLEGMKGDRR